LTAGRIAHTIGNAGGIALCGNLVFVDTECGQLDCMLRRLQSIVVEPSQKLRRHGFGLFIRPHPEAALFDENLVTESIDASAITPTQVCGL
jgi:hypothetical protein